jgi:hypothetical protein
MAMILPALWDFRKCGEAWFRPEHGGRLFPVIFSGVSAIQTPGISNPCA